MSSLFTPLSILAPDKPLALSSLGTNTSKTDWVLNGETELLLCAYCVSHDQKWLLATFCDRSGELLSTAVIGIHPAKYVLCVMNFAVGMLIVTCVEWLVRCPLTI